MTNLPKIEDELTRLTSTLSNSWLTNVLHVTLSFLLFTGLYRHLVAIGHIVSQIAMRQKF